MKRTARIAVMLLAVVGPVAAARAQAPPAQAPPAQAPPAQAPPAQALVPVPLAPGSSVARFEAVAEDAPTPVLAAELAAQSDRERFWGYADYLLGFFRSQSLPPLVTTSPAGTPITQAGVLSNPKTQVLFGGNGVNDGLRSGLRVGFGGWFDAPKTIGVDVGFLMMESQAALFSTNSQVNPILARPFISFPGSKETSQIVAFPGRATGSITASDRSDNLYGAHMDFKEIFLADTGYRLESIFGYRFLSINDGLSIDQDVKSLGGGGVLKGTQFTTNDSFTTQNQFHGLDMGVRAEFSGERWWVSLLGKVAVGDIHRVVSIAGLTQVMVPGMPTVTSAGGLLALSSNSGTFHRDQFTAVPEAGANLGWNITSQWRVHVGYSILFLNDIARGADQVSLLLNPNLFPPPRTVARGLAAPFFSFTRADTWVQTVNLGMEFRY
jgi:hypothetical protein